VRGDEWWRGLPARAGPNTSGVAAAQWAGCPLHHGSDGGEGTTAFRGDEWWRGLPARAGPNTSGVAAAQWAGCPLHHGSDGGEGTTAFRGDEWWRGLPARAGPNTSGVTAAQRAGCPPHYWEWGVGSGVPAFVWVVAFGEMASHRSPEECPLYPLYQKSVPCISASAARTSSRSRTREPNASP
jgi:hypothetical protein